MNKSLEKPLSRKLKVLFLSLGKFLTTIAALISSIFLSRLLTIDEYANYRQTLLVYSFLGPFLALGFDRAMFYNFEHKKENHGEQLLNIQYVLLSIAVLFSLLFIAGGSGIISKLFNNPAIEKTIIIYSLFMLVNIPTILLQSVLVIKNKVKLLTVINILNKLISVLFSIIIAFFYRDAVSIFISLLFTGIIAFVVVEVILIKNTSKIKKFTFDKKVLKDYTNIGFPLFLASVLGLAGKNIDKLLISTFMTPADYAIYSNGAIEIPIIGAVTGAVMLVILVDFTKLLNKGKVSETFQLWRKSVEVSSSFLVPLMFLLMLNADWLIVAMFGEKYVNSVLPFKVYLLLLPIRTMVFSSIIIAKAKTKIITKGTLLFFISNLILSILFIELYGIIGPAVATVITTYLLGFYFSFRITKIIKISFLRVFDIKSIFPFVLIGMISFISGHTILEYMMFDKYFNIIFSNVIFILLFYFGVLISGKISIYKGLILMLKKK